MKIKIDPNKNIFENATVYYDKSKKLKKKAIDTLTAIEKTKKELVKALKGEQKAKEKKAEEKPKEKTKWYEKFHWFFTSEGFLVIGGKSADQNEYVFKHHFDKNDVFFHADIRGGSVVILKRKEEDPETAPSEKSLLEAAQFAGSYSNAWKEGYAAVDVTSAHRDQVSKSPPTGEYLAKGSFVLSGSMKHFKRVGLKLLVGKTKEGILGVTPREKGIENFSKVYEIAPGSLQKNAAADKISRELKVRKEKIMPLIPAGLTSIARMK